MSKNDHLRPATKKDLRDLEKRLDGRIDRLDTKVDRLDTKVERLDAKIGTGEQSLRHDMAKLKDEILRHFDLTVETIRHDLLGANHDEIENIKDRVKKLERHTGLVAA